MIYTDCGKRLKVAHPSLAEVGCWFQDDSEGVSDQVKKFFGISGDAKVEGSLAPFVPTPAAVVKKMIELAEIEPRSMCVDLGAGDGRLLFAAVEAAEDVFATGYEKHPERYEALRAKCDGTRVAVLATDIRQAAIGKADVVFMYLLPGSNSELKAKLLKEMKPGARVVSHDFDMPDWQPDAVDVVKAEGRTHRVYMWRIPDAAVRAA
jgi:hypothetical protein